MHQQMLSLNPKQMISSLEDKVKIRIKMENGIIDQNVKQFLSDNDTEDIKSYHKLGESKNNVDYYTPKMLEFCSKLPHMSYKIEVNESLRLALKLIYTKLKSQTINNHKQLRFFFSFCKNIFGVGFLKTQIKKLKEFDFK